MATYYLYLWRRTWPFVTLFVLLYFFVCLRFIWKAHKTWRYERDAWGVMVLMLKGWVWAGVLIAYTLMFIQAEGDWFEKPLVIRGTLELKDVSEGRYRLAIQPGATTRETVFVNDVIFRSLKAGDEVKLTVLPIRREVTACEVIKRP